ncbi:MAG: 30S ribosomal protein S4 [Candidatus Nealsonbacteria bacterium]|nr:30S ribosomal protein S4 [Candidatus Nealsonbacteria bacterium]
MKKNNCKICRRLGSKLFLKGEKCLSPKCSLLKKPYPPGVKKKKRFKALSDYGKELKEKQKLKNWYNLKEGQFRRYVKDILERRNKVEDAVELLIQKLETRFDNVIFRLGLASSRSQARQLVSHRHFLINGKIVNIPSYHLKKGDKITIRPASKKLLEKSAVSLKKYQPPVWLKINIQTLEGEVIGQPTFQESAPPAEISTIFEYYSR